MIYRTEHPKPQFEREAWENLNGEWQFEIDRGNSGAARGLFADTVTLSGKINVPFCPQSSLSGVADRDFMNSVWYRRTFEITDEGSWGSRGKQLSIMDLLGVGAFSKEREDEIRSYFTSL